MERGVSPPGEGPVSERSERRSQEGRRKWVKTGKRPNSKPRNWIDNHCHIPGGDESDQWVSEALAAGVEQMVTVGVTVELSREAIAVAARHESVYATVGVHPHDSSGGIDGLAELIDADHVVAIGEAGLDYHYDHSPRPIQCDVFAQQIALAHDHDLPLVIHTREAWDDTFAILDSEGVPTRTVLHCFTGGPAEADAGLARGMMVSVSGIATFPSAEEVREAIVACPLDRLMVETDSPYLAPVPHRGKPNRPANVIHVGEAIALFKGLEIDDVAEATSSSARIFYQLPETNSQ